MVKRNFIWFGLLIWLLFASKYSLAQNIALDKPYVLSEKPNYPSSAPSTDVRSLTDGKYTPTKNGKRFWSNKTTVGWTKKDDIKIDIDLEKVNNIEGIVLNSAAGTGSVHFPQNIFAFISSNGKEYEYVGDLMEGEKHEYGTYQIKKFTLDHIKRSGQYVRLIVLPQEKYFFTDEIEVLASGEKAPVAKKQLSKEETHRYVQETKGNELKNKRAQNLGAFYLEKKIPVSDKNKQTRSTNSIKDVRLQLAHHLNQEFTRELTLERQSPWTTLTSGYIPKSHSDTLSYFFRIPKNQHGFGSFILTNSGTHKKNIKIELTNNQEKAVEFTFFHSVFTETGEMEKVSDALLPINSVLSLDPGETGQVFFKIKGKKEREFKQQIKVSADEEELKIDLSGVIQKEIDKLTPGLNANVWAYLDYPSLIDMQESASEDLQSHYINTAIIKRTALPDIKKPQKAQDYKNLLKTYNNVDYILLYVSLKNAFIKNDFWQSPFLSQEWKSNFKKWYATIEKETKKILPNAQIYFYPYDEISSKEDMQDFNRLIDWARKDFPELKFYATLNKKENIYNFIDRVDIAQIHPEDMTLSRVKNTKTEVWTYKNTAEARKASPYKFYRMKAWEAYLNGSKGVGFWNYAYQRTKDWNEYVYNLSLDYSVVYTSDNNLIPTRRWEAFAKGLEDYKIIKRYEKEVGEEETRKLVKTVLSNVDDQNLADNIIDKMLQSL